MVTADASIPRCHCEDLQNETQCSLVGSFYEQRYGVFVR